MGALSFLFQNAFGGAVLSLLRSLHELKMMTFNCNSVLLSINAKLKKHWQHVGMVDQSMLTWSLLRRIQICLLDSISCWKWETPDITYESYETNKTVIPDWYISYQRFHFPKTITRLTNEKLPYCALPRPPPASRGRWYPPHREPPSGRENCETMLLTMLISACLSTPFRDL